MEPDSPSRTLKPSEISAAFGLKARAARGWAAAGCPHDDLGQGRGNGKRFNLLEVRRWVQETGRRLSNGGGPSTLTAADMMGSVPSAKKKPAKKKKKKKKNAKPRRRPSAPVSVSVAVAEVAEGVSEGSGFGDQGLGDGDDFDFLDHKQQLSLANLRKTLAMAQKYELDIEVKRGSLLPVEDVERGRLERVAFARSRLIGGPSMLAPDLAQCSLETIEDALSSWVAAVLGDLAGTAEP